DPAQPDHQRPDPVHPAQRSARIFAGPDAVAAEEVIRWQTRRQRMVHILGKLRRRRGVISGAAALCFTLAASSPQALAQLAEEPRYAPSGELLLPNGFETWVFVGSNLGLSYAPDAAAAAAAPPPRAGRQQFHNVSINKAAYDHFMANGQFPDRTV